MHAQGAQKGVHQAVGGKQGIAQTVDDDPGDEMRQGGDGLDRLPEVNVGDFVEQNGKDGGKKQHAVLEAGEDHGVGEHTGKGPGGKQVPEILQTHESA